MLEIKAEHGLRGDYSAIRPDYTIDQEWRRYSDEEHAIWRMLYRRQRAMLPRYACREFIEAVAALDAESAIPDFARVNDRLGRATGWQIVAVPGLIPTDIFFHHLANRRFPVTVWIRTMAELDYLVEPDLFHDFFGHVPLLMNPVFADYMAAYGRKGDEAVAHDALKLLGRFYWYMVEFGLIRAADGSPRAFGAGILSSAGELRYAVEDPRPNRIRFDIRRVMRTDYRIDAFQETYFVIDDFAEMFQATGRDFVPLYASLRGQPLLAANAICDSDTVLHRGAHAIRPAA